MTDHERSGGQWPQHCLEVSCVVETQQGGQKTSNEAGESSPSEPTGCLIIDSVGNLLALGLSQAEIDELECGEPSLAAIREYARVSDKDDTDSSKTRRAIEETLDSLSTQMEGIDLQLQMLDLRKAAMFKRIQALNKLLSALRRQNKRV